MASIVDLVITNNIRKGLVEDPDDRLSYMEYVIGIIWCFTFIWNVLVSDETWFKKVFNFERLRDFINLYSIFHNAIY